MAKNTVTVSILSDAKNFGKGLDAASGKAGRFGKSLKIGLGLAVTGLAAATVGIGKAVQAASALEQSTGAIDAVFKSGSAGMKRYAATASTTVGLTTNEFQELATVLGAQLKNGGTSIDQLGGKTQSLIATAADLSAQFGGSTSDAVNALSSALKGERDPIERYGVSLKQASIDAEAARLGFKKVGGSLSAEANQAATLSLIMKQTADAHGAFGRESDTLAHKQQVLKSQIGDLSAKIGTAFLPVFSAATGAVSKLIGAVSNSAAFQHITTAIAGFLTKLLDGNSALGGFASNALKLATTISPLGIIFKALEPVLPIIATALQNLAAALGGALSQILPVIVQLVGKLVEILSGVFAAILPVIVQLVSTLADIIGVAVQAIAPLVEVIGGALMDVLDALSPLLKLIATVFGDVLKAILPVIVKAVTPLIGVLLKLITPLIELIGPILKPLIQLFTTLLKPILALLTPILNLLTPAIEGIGNVLSFVIGWITKAISWFVKLVTGNKQAGAQFQAVWRGVQSFFAGIGRFFANIWNGLVTGVGRFILNIVGKIKGIPGSIIRIFSGAGRWLWDAGRNIINGLINGAGSLLRNVGSFFLNMLPGWIQGPFRAALGINSPSRLFAGFGENLVQGLVNGTNKLKGLARSTMGGLAATVTSGFTDGSADLRVTATADSASGVAPRTYNITVQAVAPGAEVGRAVLDAIHSYEATRDLSGRQGVIA